MATENRSKITKAGFCYHHPVLGRDLEVLGVMVYKGCLSFRLRGFRGTKDFHDRKYYVQIEEDRYDHRNRPR